MVQIYVYQKNKKKEKKWQAAGHRATEERQQGAAGGAAAAEGAVAMCRAQRSARPLDHVAAELEAVINAAIVS